MVMQKVRASSYVRRALSMPMNRKRLPGRTTDTPTGESPASHGDFDGGVESPHRTLHRTLLISSGPSLSALEEDEGLAAESGSTAESTEEEEILAEAPPFTIADDLGGLFSILVTWTNLLLVFIPLGLLAQTMAWGPLARFGFNFVALLPLAAILGAATEELALHTGEIFGGLLNATFGNAVEVIISVQALKAGLVSVVQGTLLGSILSNLLLVLGMALFAGGLGHHVQRFNEKGATSSGSLLLLSCMAITLPTVASMNAGGASDADVLTISRITAVVIGLTYLCFLFFQLYTHLDLFQDQEDGGVCEWPSISWSSALLLLALVTILVAVHSEFLVAAIGPVVSHYGLPESFIGVILLPIVGNAAEHMTAVAVAIRDKVDLAMGVAVGSSAQIALFVVPFTVVAGWIMDVPMTLAFPAVSAIVLVMAVLVSIAVIQDGESNWLEGILLMAAYLIVAVIYWFDKAVVTPPKSVSS
eukprot:GHVT01026221.1.p1 GENE.GHVT01026221.1~~GHVT01026221.1.p1  ORF type:complete len:474 (+),score=109.88 GHVT01026221.1:514-1935(+)